MSTLRGLYSPESFLPTDIPNIFAWYQDNSFVRNPSNGILGWADLSPNKNDAYQETSGNRPTLVTNQINNRPVTRFVASGLIHLFTPNTGINLESTDFSIVCAAKIATLTTGQVGAILTNRILGTGTDWFAFGVAQDTGVGNPPNKILVERRTVSGLYNVYVSSYTPDNTFSIYCLTKTSTQLNIFRNGTNILSVDGNTGGGTATNRPWRIGLWFENNQGLPGDICFMTIYHNKALNSTERQQIERYINSRYSIY